MNSIKESPVSTVISSSRTSLCNDINQAVNTLFRRRRRTRKLGPNIYRAANDQVRKISINFQDKEVGPALVFEGDHGVVGDHVVQVSVQDEVLVDPEARVNINFGRKQGSVS